MPGIPSWLHIVVSSCWERTTITGFSGVFESEKLTNAVYASGPFGIGPGPPPPPPALTYRQRFEVDDAPGKNENVSSTVTAPISTSTVTSCAPASRMLVSAALRSSSVNLPVSTFALNVRTPTVPAGPFCRKRHLRSSPRR